MEQFLIGLALMVIGLLFTFAGYQLFRVIIPIWGLIAGFAWGADITNLGAGAGFFSAFFGLIIALGAGLLLGALAYFFYEFAVAILAASVGYWFVGGILLALGLPFGFIGVTIALLAAAALAWAAIYYKAPKGILMLFSTVGGGAVAIAGTMVIFGIVSPAILGYGLMGEIIRQSFWWTLAWAGLIVVGILTQMQLSNNMSNEMAYPSSFTSSPFTGAKGGSSKKQKEDETSETEVL